MVNDIHYSIGSSTKCCGGLSAMAPRKWGYRLRFVLRSLSRLPLNRVTRSFLKVGKPLLRAPLLHCLELSFLAAPSASTTVFADFASFTADTAPADDSAATARLRLPRPRYYRCCLEHIIVAKHMLCLLVVCCCTQLVLRLGGGYLLYTPIFTTTFRPIGQATLYLTLRWT